MPTKQRLWSYDRVPGTVAMTVHQWKVVDRLKEVLSLLRQAVFPGNGMVVEKTSKTARSM